MDIISYVHKSEELLFQILGLVEVWTSRSMELSPDPVADKRKAGLGMVVSLAEMVCAAG
jgi:hypothetical protein